MSEYKTMSLSECAKFDYKNGLANKITGWGKICAKFAGKGSMSRRDRTKGKINKRRHFQNFCREMARKGMINTPDGKFVPKGTVRQDSMVRDYFAGYKMAS